MTEEIQQLKATISILIEQNPRRNESPNTHKYEHIESSNEARSEEVYAQQGAKPKRKPEDIRYIRTTCHVEGEELDEHSAVQLLPENKRSFPQDLCFNIITAEKKCLLLELKATSKILQDIESFRMALRALIIQIALAGKIDINKPSTITLKLIFKDDLTEDDMNVMKQISGRSFTSRIIEGSLTYPPVRKVNKEDNCKNCEYLKKEVIHQLESTNRALILSVFELELLCSWHVRERSKLAFENRQLELAKEPEQEMEQVTATTCEIEVQGGEELDSKHLPRNCKITKWPDFQGYGFILNAERDRVGQFICKIDDDSPSEEAGLREGDRIIEVNGANIEKETQQQVIARIKAGRDCTTMLLLDREGDDHYKSKGITVYSNMSIVKQLFNQPRGKEVRSSGVDDYIDLCSDLRLVQNVTKTDKSSSDSSGTGSMIKGSRGRSGSIHEGSRSRSGSMTEARQRRAGSMIDDSGRRSGSMIDVSRGRSGSTRSFID